MTTNFSPWAIGEAWHDQRDLYTRGSSIEADGYGRGPGFHPSKGSYDYPRPPRRPMSQKTGATLYEREAYPWLNYKAAESDRYFAHLHQRSDSWWSRLRGIFSKSKVETRPDRVIEDDVRRALDENPELIASDVDVIVKQGSVVLEGTVIDANAKRLAGHLAEQVRGVRHVDNQLHVRHDDPTDANVAFVRSLSVMGAFVGI